MTLIDSALLAWLKRWRWPLATGAVVVLVLAVVLLEPFTARHRERVAGDRAAAVLRSHAEMTMDALKGELKDPLQDYFGELWLANGKLVCGFVDVADGSPSNGGWEPFVGYGGLVYRITDKSAQARAWFKACAFGRIKMIYPGTPGPDDMTQWLAKG